ncbi:hypothetical protein BCR42DRAFT_409644 [Absidia repens]|uniref:CBM1 domain-containing protein n=1 Tax=Absidia repens TaxID=90262 RepID=A0A1X2IMX0_9FUNG|nr:hypothetical protein BCR42DRAFT_409644 [Absidia repens]
MQRIFELLLIVLVLLVADIYGAALPTNRSLHEMCSQNLVCSDNLYCRRYNGAVYGSCEIP